MVSPKKPRRLSRQAVNSLIFGIGLALALAAPAARAGEAYFTGFENFTTGDDTIVGTDSWTGSAAHLGMKLDGVMSEAQHGVAGIGNAAYIGGYATTTASTANKTVYVRKAVNLDPVALSQEVATFSVTFGIKDSLTTTKRDNFEFLVYNKDNLLLGGIQFDNTTLDSSTLEPRRLIYRLSWNGTAFQYVLTPFTFLPETLETLRFRINFRTNRWTVSLSDVPIFQDIPFYTGSSAKTLGSVMVKMAVGNASATSPFYILPGDNYMLFDNFTIRTDPVTTTLAITKNLTGAAKLTWNEEAGYTYQVAYSTDAKTWKTDLANSSHTASLTQTATFTDPTTPVPVKRIYRIQSTPP